MAFERSKKNFTTKVNISKKLVNTPTPYEVTIAAKLEQLPVPDMADSIWASIEMQLDADLSSDNSDQSPPQHPTKGLPGMSKGFYLSILTAIIIAIVLIYKANKNHRMKNDNTPAPVKKEVVITVADSNQNSNLDAEKKRIDTLTVPIKKDSMFNSFIPGNRITFDSVSKQTFPSNKQDSSSTIKSKPLLPSLDSIPPPLLIKPRGIKGITDDDYKLRESKKDSLKKGG
jgi:hypothetical protein